MAEPIIVASESENVETTDKVTCKMFPSSLRFTVAKIADSIFLSDADDSSQNTHAQLAMLHTAP